MNEIQIFGKPNLKWLNFIKNTTSKFKSKFLHFFLIITIIEKKRDTARQLVEENTSLLDYMKQTEKDTMEVVGYLRKIDTEKETEVNEEKER